MGGTWPLCSGRNKRCHSKAREPKARLFRTARGTHNAAQSQVTASRGAQAHGGSQTTWLEWFQMCDCFESWQVTVCFRDHLGAQLSRWARLELADDRRSRTISVGGFHTCGRASRISIRARPSAALREQRKDARCPQSSVTNELCAAARRTLGSTKILPGSNSLSTTRCLSVSREYTGCPHCAASLAARCRVQMEWRFGGTRTRRPR